MLNLKKILNQLHAFGAKFIGLTNYYYQSLQQEYADKKAKDIFNSFLNRAVNFIDSSFSYFKKEIYCDEFLARLHDNFAWLSIAGLVLSFLKSSYDLYYAIFHIEDTTNKVVSIFTSCFNFALAIVGTLVLAGALVVAAPAVILISSIKGTIEGFYHVGRSIYDRFFGEGAKDAKKIAALKEELKHSLSLQPEDGRIQELTDLINKQRERNKKILEKTHSLIMNISALVSAALIISGIGAKIGIILMTVTTAYGASTLFGLNPIINAFTTTCTLSKICFGQRFFLDIFSKKSAKEVVNDLNKEFKSKATKPSIAMHTTIIKAGVKPLFPFLRIKQHTTTLMMGMMLCLFPFTPTQAKPELFNDTCKPECTIQQEENSGSNNSKTMAKKPFYAPPGSKNTATLFKALNASDTQLSSLASADLERPTSKRGPMQRRH